MRRTNDSDCGRSIGTSNSARNTELPERPLPQARETAGIHRLAGLRMNASGHGRVPRKQCWPDDPLALLAPSGCVGRLQTAGERIAGFCVGLVGRRTPRNYCIGCRRRRRGVSNHLSFRWFRPLPHWMNGARGGVHSIRPKVSCLESFCSQASVASRKLSWNTTN